MPVDTAFVILGKAKDVVMFIINRLEQLKLCDNIVIRIKENLVYMQQTIKKIEPHIKKESESAECLQLLDHLQSAAKHVRLLLKRMK